MELDCSSSMGLLFKGFSAHWMDGIVIIHNLHLSPGFGPASSSIAAGLCQKYSNAQNQMKTLHNKTTTI